MHITYAKYYVKYVCVHAIFRYERECFELHKTNSFNGCLLKTIFEKSSKQAELKGNLLYEVHSIKGQLFAEFVAYIFHIKSNALSLRMP